MMFMLFITISKTFAQSRDGSATVKVREYTTVSLSYAFQRTLSESTNITYSWYSDSPSIASVSGSSMYSATVLGNSVGSCRVYYQASYRIDGYYRTMNFYYEITVQSNGPTSITVNPGSQTLYEGDDCTLYASLSGGTSSISWSSGNSTVASVNGSGTTAYVSAKSEGTAYIYARTTNGLSDYCIVTVKKKVVTPTSITLPASVSVNEDEYTTITATVQPSNASYTLTWSSADTDIATVNSSGRVYGKKAGTVRITAKVNGYSLSDYCDVTVKAKNVSATELALEIPSVLEVGETYKVVPTVTPENATVSYSYKSSNEAVATISSTGIVTARSKGLAVITVTENNSGLKTTGKFNVIGNSWSGTYHLNATVETGKTTTREYPASFDMTISRKDCQYYVTSFLFDDEYFVEFNDGGFPLEVSDENSGVISISYNFLTYDRSTLRLYTVHAYDDDADDWTYSVPVVKTNDGNLTVGTFYIGCFEYDENTEDWSNSGLLEAVYYNASTVVGQPSLTGDVNGDNEVNGTDLVALTNIILGRSERTSASDVNGDGEVNGTDYVKLTNIILGKKMLRKRLPALKVKELEHLHNTTTTK